MTETSCQLYKMTVLFDPTRRNEPSAERDKVRLSRSPSAADAYSARTRSEANVRAVERGARDRREDLFWRKIVSPVKQPQRSPPTYRGGAADRARDEATTEDGTPGTTSRASDQGDTTPTGEGEERQGDRPQGDDRAPERR